jgi:hypothetical protein
MAGLDPAAEVDTADVVEVAVGAAGSDAGRADTNATDVAAVDGRILDADPGTERRP